MAAVGGRIGERFATADWWGGSEDCRAEKVGFVRPQRVITLPPARRESRETASWQYRSRRESEAGEDTSNRRRLAHLKRAQPPIHLSY